MAPKAYSVAYRFSYTAYIDTHWTTLVGMLGVLAILLPLTRALPALYAGFRRRLVYWYRQLKALERNLDSGPYDAAALQAEFDRIDSAVRRIRVPLYYSDKLYDLRGHIDLVRQRPCRAADADQDGGRVARVNLRVREAFSFKRRGGASHD